MIHGHGGNIRETAAELGCAPEEIVDMSSNINPLGPMPGLLDHLCGNISSICRLPDVSAVPAAAAYAGWQGLAPERVLAGAGTTEFLYQIPKALGLSSALVVAPTYADYADALALHGVFCHPFLLTEQDGFAPDIEALAADAKTVDAVFFCNPNNPTGLYTPIPEVERLARSCPDTCFIIDESYLPFVRGIADASIAEKELGNVVVLQSLSKMFSVPGLRIGFCVADAAAAEKIARRLPPWGVNSLAQEAVFYIAGSPGTAAAHAARTRSYLAAERSAFMETMQNCPDVLVFPGEATFLLLRLCRFSASELAERLLEHRLLVRNCSNFEGLSEQFLRVSLKDEQNNRLAAGCIRACMSG
ncbi:MAG: aminotransferase class I/II-fold pyridoxal phosphate-dependent enzyme [Desulfosalsimonadaceae bacterium]